MPEDPALAGRSRAAPRTFPQSRPLEDRTGYRIGWGSWLILYVRQASSRSER